MTQALAERTPTASAIEQVLIKGDLSGLNEAQRLTHYKNVCESLGLNPLTTPFDYLKLNGKTVLYAKRDAAEQLRKIHGVSIVEIQTAHVGDVYVVTVKAQDKHGRTDASMGAVTVGNLKGDNLANALMKAETKAKRRVTLSICGLGMLDETEIETIHAAKPEGYTVTAPVASKALPAPGRSSSDASPTVEAERGDSDSRPSGAEPLEGATLPSGSNSDEGPDLFVDQPDPDALRIVRVEHKPTANKNVTRHILVLSDGREVVTIKEQWAALADELCQERAVITLDTKSGKFGEDLVALHRAATNAEMDADIAKQELARQAGEVF